MLPIGLIGVVHLPAIPGDPGHDGRKSFSDALEFALRDAEALVEGGVEAMIIENFGSAPFPKGSEGARILPHQVAFLTRVARECRGRFDVAIGVNCLRNDAPAAVGIAAAAELDFVRVNVHVGAAVTDQGIIEGEAHHTVRYRQALGAKEVAILADVFVKHASPLGAFSCEDVVGDTLKRGHADGVIVTGKATGSAVDREFLERVVRAAESAPVFIGSGLNEENAAALVPLVHGAIVGTYFKEEGRIERPVDVERVRRLSELVRGGFRTA